MDDEGLDGHFFAAGKEPDVTEEHSSFDELARGLADDTLSRSRAIKRSARPSWAGL